MFYVLHFLRFFRFLRFFFLRFFRFLPPLLPLVLLTLLPFPLISNAWEARIIADPFTPELFLTIDKEKQKLFVLLSTASKNPLHKITKAKEFSCSTGKVRGDKQKQGDLKTPEGIYFIEKRLSQGLDYDLYGNLAFTLNYPNPIDRIQGKTGYGIWIHGRGHTITDYETRGCVAMNMPDIELLEQSGIILQKTPVVIARTVTWQSKAEAAKSAEAAVAAEIVRLTRLWARNWSKKSNEFLSFYDNKKFSLSGQNFYYFKKRKIRLFRKYPWIDVYIHQPRALVGPGYVVSFFEQLYRTPTFCSSGIKRLYWQKSYANANDASINQPTQWKIVGSEWRDADTALDNRIKHNYLKARKEELIKWLEHWRISWERADLQKYALFYTRDAIQGKIKGLHDILENKKRIWSKSGPPKKIKCQNFDIKLDKQGFVISFVQKYESKKGYTDVGLKRLTITPSPSGWRITSESWRNCNVQDKI